MKRSSVTAWLRGAPCDFQPGKSSPRPRGSITAPERMCAPTSEPFSTTQTENSLPCFAHSCLRWIAVASPAGPAPTTTTSYSIASRSLMFSILSLAHYSHEHRGHRGTRRTQRKTKTFERFTLTRALDETRSLDLPFSVSSVFLCDLCVPALGVC